MVIGKTSKNLLISFISGVVSLVLFIFMYSMCFWGGCGDTRGVLLVIAAILIVSIIFFLLWLRDILKLTFANRPDEASEDNSKRDNLLSIVSLGLLGNAIYNIYYLERISELVRTEVLYSKGIKSLFIIIGVIGIWLHRRWGALITIAILLVIALPIIWKNIIYSDITNPYLIIGYIAAIIVLVRKFRDMK